MATDENPFAGQGSVLLDIGGDIGALVVTMPAAMDGLEIEIRPAGHANDHVARLDSPSPDHQHHEHDHGHAHLPHVAVVPRPTADGLVHSLVFPELRQGTYELYVRPGGPVELTVTITGGQVTEAAWPGAT